jgi:hypothetical protein
MQRLSQPFYPNHQVCFIFNILKLLFNLIFWFQKILSGTFDAQGIDRQLIKSIKAETINRRLQQLRDRHECSHPEK